MLSCLSVIKVEGLRSSKAIAFIQDKSNPRVARLKTKTYSILRTFPQKTKIFSKKLKFCLGIRLNVRLTKKLGDKKWIN